MPHDLPPLGSFHRLPLFRRLMLAYWGTSEHEAEVSLSINRLGRKLDQIMHTLEETLAAVQAESTSSASIITLLVGIKKQLDDALGDALTPSQQMRVDAIFNEATKNKQAIDDAVKANTEGNTPPDGGTLVPTKTSITSSGNPAAPGDTITISAGLDVHPDSIHPNAPTGTMTFFDGDAALGTAAIDSTGVAAISSTTFPGGNLAVGDHSLHATYGGDALYAPSDSLVLVQTIAAPAGT